MKYETGLPTEPGRYVCFLGKGQREIVLWWSTQSRDWRDGARVVRVLGFFGPLPEIES